MGCIKVGDTVRAISSGFGYTEGRLYTVARLTSPFSSRFIDVIDQETGENGFGCFTSSFEKVKLPKHEGKILIMVDEKDNNKIVAHDLITDKTAEAKRNPKDEWDFNKGAKLALERLTEPEKPKGWTGKVVLVQADADTPYFKRGRVYTVSDGLIFDETGTPYGTERVFSLNDLNARFKYREIGNRQFIEYKGGAEK